MKISDPIGIFDSGVGGLSVLKELIHLLPNESFIYFADNKHAPYGRKDRGDVMIYAEDISEHLIELGAKLIVVACNTATGIAINHLRKQFTIPFVGMEPAVKPAAAQSKTGKIGVLATANTFEADHFNKTRNRFANHVEVIMTVGDGLVELVESGMVDSSETKKLLEAYLLPMIDQGIDQLVLGCTHYPFLIPAIRRIIPDDVTIHDPAPAVAKQAQRILQEMDLLNTGKEKPVYSFEASGDSKVLEEMAFQLKIKA
jgi:glutamate racemase